MSKVPCLGAHRRSVIIKRSRESNPQSVACSSRTLPLSHDAPHLFTKLGWMPMADRLKYQRAVEMYNCLNNECPPSLQGMFTLKAQVHNYRTRSTTIENLHLPKVTKKAFSTQEQKHGIIIIIILGLRYHFSPFFLWRNPSMDTFH